MLSREDFYMIKQMRQQGARTLSILRLRLVALNGRSDAISNTLNRQPERPATKGLS